VQLSSDPAISRAFLFCPPIWKTNSASNPHVMSSRLRAHWVGRFWQGQSSASSGFMWAMTRGEHGAPNRGTLLAIAAARSTRCARQHSCGTATTADTATAISTAINQPIDLPKPRRSQLVRSSGRLEACKITKFRHLSANCPRESCGNRARCASCLSSNRFFEDRLPSQVVDVRLILAKS
jgi:hypothetical protein